MARTPKAAPLPPIPARRGRKPKTSEPIEFAAATNGAVEEAEAVEVEAATVTPVEKPARGKPGPKPKPRSKAAAPALPEQDDGQPDIVLEQAPDQDDAMIAEMAYPVSADVGGATTSSDNGMYDASSAASQGGSEQAKSAARWDRAADKVQFDWPEIERTALQNGPNQVMAKLLVAARAEGANSRWPF